MIRRTALLCDKDLSKRQVLFFYILCIFKFCWLLILPDHFIHSCHSIVISLHIYLSPNVLEKNEGGNQKELNDCNSMFITV